MENKFLYIKKQCKKCNGKGYIWSNDRHIFGQEEKDPIQCECLKKMMLYMHLHSANVSREYYDLTMSDFNAGIHKDKIVLKPRIQKMVDDPDDLFRRGRGIFFYGTNGTGKTMLSIEILKAAVKHKYSIHYEFYPIVYETFLKKGYKADDLKEKMDNIFSNVDFLVLDEIGKELDGSHASKSASEKLLEIHILKKRADKVTILISNKSPEEIQEIYGKSVFSMLSLNHDFIQVPGHDYRGDINA